MPYKSMAQMRFLHAVHPDIAKRWDKKYGKPGKLPKKLTKQRYSNRSGLSEAFPGHAGRPGQRGGSAPIRIGHWAALGPKNGPVKFPVKPNVFKRQDLARQFVLMRKLSRGVKLTAKEKNEMGPVAKPKIRLTGRQGMIAWNRYARSGYRSWKEAFMGHAGRPGRIGGSVAKIKGKIVSGFKNLAARFSRTRKMPTRVGAAKYRLAPAAMQRYRLHQGGGTGGKIPAAAKPARAKPSMDKRPTNRTKPLMERPVAPPVGSLKQSAIQRPKVGAIYDPKANVLILGKRPSPAVVKLLRAKGINLPDRPKKASTKKTPTKRRAA